MSNKNAKAGKNSAIKKGESAVSFGAGVHPSQLKDKNADSKGLLSKGSRAIGGKSKRQQALDELMKELS